MATYSPPNFNVLADLWFGSNVPFTSLPDFEDQACQFYVYSRGLLDITPSDEELWVPPIYLRLPLASIVNWRNLQVVECPPASGRWFRARWKERMHMGFPNEYLVVILQQCDAEGNWILRDVIGGPTPVDHAAEGNAVLELEFTPLGSATNGLPPVEHSGTGEAVLDLVFEPAGVGQQL